MFASYLEISATALSIKKKIHILSLVSLFEGFDSVGANSTSHAAVKATFWFSKVQPAESLHPSPPVGEPVPDGADQEARLPLLGEQHACER